MGIRNQKSEISDQETWKRIVAPTALAVCALLFPG